MPLYPLALKLAGRRCVVVGGGRVAERKVASLLESGADVHVVSPDTTPGLAGLARDGKIVVRPREFATGDTEGALLVIAATSKRAVNEAVYADAQAHGAITNVADVPDLCDFYVPASVSRGGLRVTVSTGGACPALAKRLRKELEKTLGPEYEAYITLLAELREALRRDVTDAEKRKEAIEAFLDSSALERIAAGRMKEAQDLLAAHIAAAKDGHGRTRTDMDGTDGAAP